MQQENIRFDYEAPELTKFSLSGLQIVVGDSGCTDPVQELDGHDFDF